MLLGLQWKVALAGGGSVTLIFGARWMVGERLENERYLANAILASIPRGCSNVGAHRRAEKLFRLSDVEGPALNFLADRAYVPRKVSSTCDGGDVTGW